MLAAPMKPARAILHVDMDAFYASVEQRDNPELKGRPVVVGWPGNRGVVAAASYEVRKFGVRSALPMHAAMRLCPHAVCVKPRMQQYKEVSRQVFAVFREFTPLVEGLSLDEAFLDVSAHADSCGAAAEIARRIKARIREQTQLTASVGVSVNKLVAKIASDLAKPDGLSVVTPDNLYDVLDPLSVRRLPGLGGKTGAKVEALGIQTLGQLRVAADGALWPIFGRYTQRVRERAGGIDERPVSPDLEDKSISAEDTFEVDISDPARLQTELARLAELACTRMRSKRLVAGCVTVKIRRHDFSTFTRQRSISPPTGETRTISNVAHELLGGWLSQQPRARLRLLGVGVSHLTLADQLELFRPAGPCNTPPA
jgi:DNA polymerase-4